MRISHFTPALFGLLSGAVLTQQPGHAQTPPSEPLAFEVATIKASEPPKPGQFQRTQIRFGLQVDASRVNMQFMSLMDIAAAAYRVKPYQISGPGWMNTDRFDIVAKIPDGVPQDKVPEMLQSLLGERFKLTVHRDNKDHAVYALVAAKGGPKLKESSPDAEPASPDPNPGSPPPPPGGPAVADGPMTVRRDGQAMVVRGGPIGNMRMTMNPGGNLHMESEKITMPAFADMLTRFVDRPVVDMTGLTATYRIDLDLSMEDMRNAARNSGMMPPGGPPPGGPGGDAARAPSDSASDPSGGGSIFTAVQQLGLKLEARKAPLDLIVIDHLEKEPTEN